MEFFLELIITIFAELVGAGIEAGIDSSRHKRKHKQRAKAEEVASGSKGYIVIRFEAKRKAVVLTACIAAALLLIAAIVIVLFNLFESNAHAAAHVAAAVIMLVLLIIDILAAIWIAAYRIIFDREKFTVITGILPKRIVMHRDIDNITIDKKMNKNFEAVVLKFYIKGKKRVRFVSSHIDYDHINKLLDKYLAARGRFGEEVDF